MPEPDDQQLLAEFTSANSETAFAALVGRYVNLVYSTALRFAGNAQAAEEISQAVFIILARKAAGLRRGVVLSGWLYQTARLTAANYVKQDIRRQRREQEAYMQSTLNEPKAPDWEDIAPLLDEAMGGLGEADRNAIVLRFFENKTSREVAAAFKTTEAAAHMRVHRALEKLHKFLTKRGVVSTTAIVAGVVSSNSVHAAPAGLANTLSTVALAKGAAASASTLTLVKGALKVMAWSKVKTITAGVVTTLLVAGGVGIVTIETIHAVRRAFAPDIQGAWEGVVHLEETGVRNGQEAQAHFVLRLFKTNGVYQATTDWPEWGKKDVSTVDVIYDYPNLVIHPTVRDTWSLKVNPNATEIFWDRYIHFIEPNPVRLRRTTAPPPVPEPLTESDFAPQPGSVLQGYWEGEVGTGADAVSVDLKIAQQADGTFRAEGDVPVQGIQGRPITVSYNPPVVEFRLADGAGMFRGQINDSDTEISGRFTQGGQSTPASIRRVDYQAEHAHDADKDYSFTSENDLQGHWKGTWIAVFDDGKIKVPIRQGLDIAKLSDGSYSATLLNVDSLGGDAPIPTSDFAYSPPNLYAEWKGQGVVYRGRFENGRIVGDWVQGGGEFHLVFERQK